MNRGELRRVVLARDQGCVLAKLDPAHRCLGRYEPVLWAYRDSDLSLEHVTQVHGPADVRRDDPEHCVGLCIGTNVKPPSKAERAIMREYLRERFPNCSKE